LLGVLSMEELDALQALTVLQSSRQKQVLAFLFDQVRGVWVLARTGTESHDKFRKTLSRPLQSREFRNLALHDHPRLALFRHRDSVTRQEVMVGT